MSGQSPLCARCKADQRLAQAALGLKTDRLWTAEDVAVYTNRTPGGILKAARDGRFPVPPISKWPHLWHPKHIQRWAESNR